METDPRPAGIALRANPASDLPPAFGGECAADRNELQHLIRSAVDAWLSKTPSRATRSSYSLDLSQFCQFQGIDTDHLGSLVRMTPAHVAAWRDHLYERGLSNATIRRKLTALRSLFSYLQIYGYAGANPAHGKFVKAPAAGRDGKTVGLSPRECRRLLDAPSSESPSGIRDRAVLGVLAYSACRVGELVRMRVGDFRSSGEHRVLNVFGKGGKERIVPLHLEAVERLADWLRTADISEDRAGPLFRPARSARGQGWDGFCSHGLTTRAVQLLTHKYAQRIGLDPAVSVHSLRVTALTTARERGSDIIALQNFAGHSDPRTTLTYIRSRDRLSKSPAYTLYYR